MKQSQAHQARHLTSSQTEKNRVALFFCLLYYMYIYILLFNVCFIQVVCFMLLSCFCLVCLFVFGEGAPYSWVGLKGNRKEHRNLLLGVAVKTRHTHIIRPRIREVHLGGLLETSILKSPPTSTSMMLGEVYGLIPRSFQPSDRKSFSLGVRRFPERIPGKTGEGTRRRKLRDSLLNDPGSIFHLLKGGGGLSQA